MPTSHREALGENRWETLRELAPVRFRAAQSELLRQDRAGTCVMLLEAGRVMVTATGPLGREQLIAVRGSGEILGEMAVLTGIKRSATVRTLTSCQVHVIPADEFRTFVDEHGLLQPLLQHSYGRIRESEQSRLELATGSVAVRLACLLTRLAGTASAETPARIGLRQEALAQLIGASRNAVGNALKEWRDRGWLTTTPSGGITVTDITALYDHATAP
ncbi:Crp/Fnr family transcriptional regulator [Kitasatospora sp. NPDC058032]|uniref:Crp/Fnr family transcriptional regulator n=1 Tax=Kitasatospora sp. NPDC058032 TaxID=3346307 RepID=UPI0036DE6F4A